jgi:uncharacterized protein YjiS (DUF1127 family)
MDVSAHDNSNASPEVEAARQKLKLAEVAAKQKKEEKKRKRKELRRLERKGLSDMGGSNGIVHNEWNKEHQAQEHFMEEGEGSLVRKEGKQDTLIDSTQDDNMEVEQVLNMEDSSATQMDVEEVATDTPGIPLASSYPLTQLYTNLRNHTVEHVGATGKLK